MENNTNQPNFTIQKVYTKDISFESANTPETFKQQWDPKVDFNLDISYKKLDEHNFEVDLTITTNTKSNDKNAYIVEVTQTGIFTISGMNEQQTESVLNTYCPNTLFPYAKRIIDSAVSRGGFIPLNLSPINFDAIYLQKKQNENKSH